MVDINRDLSANRSSHSPRETPNADDITLQDLMRPLLQRWPLALTAPLVCGLVAVAGSFLVPPEYAASTLFLPPQQQQSSAATALASLSSIAGLAAGGLGATTPADQYVALMQSVTVSDRMVDKFNLQNVYETKFREDARKKLVLNSFFSVGKKDGLVSVTVEDRDPMRAAAMANQYVIELRHLTGNLAISEAQRRRIFFEQHLAETKTRLATAQSLLQESGFSDRVIKAEPKAAAEGYARLRAELTAAEVRLQTLRGTLSDSSPEMRTQLAMVQAIRGQLAALERSNNAPQGGADYVSKYREFKYQETLFDLFARQYELARLDESREGSLIQVVDEAKPAERKSKPKRSMFGLAGAAVGFFAIASWLIVQSRRKSRQMSRHQPR